MADQKTSIVITAEDKTQAALASVRSGFAGLTQSIGSLGSVAGQFSALAGVLAGAFSGVSFKGVIDAADGINDLSQRIGIGIKDLAAWQLAADQSGTSLETVAKGVKGLSTYMVEHGDKLEKLGVKAKDANGALVELADIFSGMPDGIQKTALATELFGKAGIDMIPMLNLGSKGLAEAQEKAREFGARLAELAPEADRFNDQLSELAFNAKLVGVAMASHVVGPLGRWIEANTEAVKIAGGLGDALRLFVFNLDAMTTEKPVQEIRRLTDELEKYRASSEIGKFMRSPFGGLEEDHQKKIEFLKFLQRQEVMANAAKYGDYRDARDLFLTGPKITNIPSGFFGNSNKKGKKDRPFDPEGDFFAAVNENLFQAGKKAADEAAAATDKYDESLKKAAQSLYKATDAGAFDAMLDSIAQAEEAFARGFINQDQLDAITSNLMDVNDKLKETKSIGEEFGMTFTSAFEDAIVGAKKLSEALQGLLQDILRLVMRKTVTEPLANAVGSIDWGSLLKFNAAGGVYSGAGISAYSGQVVSRPTVFPFASGIGLMGEAGPEAILPLKRSRDGRLGVEGGGGSMVVNIIEAPGRGGEREQRSEGGVNILDVFVERIKAGIAGDISDGRGPIPAALTSAYGMNRAAGAY